MSNLSALGTAHTTVQLKSIENKKKGEGLEEAHCLIAKIGTKD